MSIEIANKELFKHYLKSGIVLFTGAGFSLLKSPSGNVLPKASDLCQDVIDYFDLKEVLSGIDDVQLSYVSEFCPYSEYQEYLRKRFYCQDYNELYDVIDRINISAYATTNIDNIIRMVISKSKRYYLHNIKEFGAPSKTGNELLYIPLHGDVMDGSSKLYFGMFELSDVDNDNGDLFNQLFASIEGKPILFIGYSFNDAGVRKIVNKLLRKRPADIWVQCMPNDAKQIRLFENLRCNIIKGDTFSLLSWIKDHCDENDGGEETIEDYCFDEKLKKYRIPTATDVEAVRLEDFYKRGITNWYSIIYDNAYERRIVNEAIDKALENKRILICGCKFSGKTTTLMQISRKVQAKEKYYITAITKDEAVFMLNNIGERPAWVFFNNCCDDIDALLEFAKRDNIYLVGTSDDYKYESIRHILVSKKVSLKVLNCNEISRDEALAMYNKIPTGIKKNKFLYREDDYEKYTMLEFIERNVEHAETERSITDMLKKIKKEREDIFKILAIASYLTDNGSAISYLIVSHVLKINPFPDAFEKVQDAINYLRDYYNFESFYDDSEMTMQDKDALALIDYFVLRSKIFSTYTKNILKNDFREDFAEIIYDFLIGESTYNIFRYHVYRITAYDASLFHDLFSLEKADKIYSFLYEQNESAFILQQQALCQARFGDFDNAFYNIDRALCMLPNNFSIKNSQAIIWFQKNIAINTPESIEYLHKAMGILNECFENDNRKLFHAQKFAEFAIDLYKKYDIADYIEMANRWMQDMTSDDEYESPKSRRLRKETERIMNVVNARKV